jgi:hypothetical protein
LLTSARLVVQYWDDELLLIDAPGGTRLRTLHPGRGTGHLHERLRVDYWQGLQVIRIDHGAGTIAFPLLLAPDLWTPVFVGTNVPNGTNRPRGRILVSQVRGDGEVSPGYEIEV